MFVEADNDISSLIVYLGCLIGRHPVHLMSPAQGTDDHPFVQRYRPNVIFRHGEDRGDLEIRHAEELDLHPEIAVLLSTSGSTGAARLVKLSRKNIQSNAESIAEYLSLTADERPITTLKIVYSYGMSVINSHLHCGATILMTDRSITNDEFWSYFEQHHATSLAGVPHTFELLDKIGLDGLDLSSLRYMTQAGGRLEPSLVRRYTEMARGRGWQFFVMYGQTEAAPRMAYLPPALAAKYPECIGVPIPGGQIRLVTDDGREITESDEPGELHYLGPNVMMGYADRQEDLATDETPDELATGDIACRNAEGLFYIVGRKARFAKPFGIRVNFDDLEAFAVEQGLTAACTGTDEYIVIAVLGGSKDTDTHRKFANRLGLPENLFVLLSYDEFPRLANDKIDYQALIAAGSAEHSQHASKLDTEFGGSPVPRTVQPHSLLLAFWHEFLSLLGQRHRGFSSVSEIFKWSIGRQQAQGIDTFRAFLI